MKYKIYEDFDPIEYLSKDRMPSGFESWAKDLLMYEDEPSEYAIIKVEEPIQLEVNYTDHMSNDHSPRTPEFADRRMIIVQGNTPVLITDTYTYFKWREDDDSDLIWVKYRHNGMENPLS